MTYDISFILAIAAIVISISGSLIGYGQLKKTSSNNEQRVSVVEARLEKTLDIIHKEMIETQRTTALQTQEIVRAIGRLEGFLEHNGLIKKRE